ncbi:hypothetical protein GCM10011500_09020 [Mucilaginibacter rubeus]|nr:hypothetical protein GCM10011500_09020 [Mucilaginibacter rubeus]
MSRPDAIRSTDHDLPEMTVGRLNISVLQANVKSQAIIKAGGPHSAVKDREHRILAGVKVNSSM